MAVVFASSTASADFVKNSKTSGGRILSEVQSRTIPDDEIDFIFLDGDDNEPFFRAVGFDLLDENLAANRLQQALINVVNNNPNVGPAFGAILKALTPNEIANRLDPFDIVSNEDSPSLPLTAFLVTVFEIYQEDPFISYRYELPNPTDETLFYVLESSQEFFPLASKGDVAYETVLKVVDHDNDGASATVNQFFASQDTSGGTALPFGVNLAVDEISPIATDGNLLTNVDLAFGVPAIGQVFTTTVSVSPGDTTIIDGFVALGDANQPLPSAALLADLQGVLLDTNAFTFELLLKQPGDFDDDGDVDGADFLEWQRNDGTAAGLALWESTFGTFSSSETLRVIPEPASIVLTIIGCCILMRRRQLSRV